MILISHASRGRGRGNEAGGGGVLSKDLLVPLSLRVDRRKGGNIPLPAITRRGLVLHIIVWGPPLLIVGCQASQAGRASPTFADQSGPDPGPVPTLLGIRSVWDACFSLAKKASGPDTLSAASASDSAKQD